MFRRINYIIYLLIVLLLIPEIILRLLGFHGENNSREFIQHDALLGWSFIPNTNVTVTGIEWRIKYLINEDGLRERMNIKNQEKGSYRILILGDSLTEGYGIRQNKRFSNLVEAMFTKENKKIEIINAGVKGYNLAQYYLFFQRLYKKYKPDLVIIAAVKGDLDVANNSIFPESDELYYRPYYNLENGQLVLKGVPIPYPNKPFRDDKLGIFKRYLRQYSVLYSFLRMASDRNIFLKKTGILLRIKKDVFKSPRYAESLYDPSYDYMLLNKQMNEKVSTAIIKKIYNTIKQNQGNLLIFLLTDDILNTNTVFYRKLCSDLGIFYADFLELNQVYRNNKSRYHFKFDGHFNEEGDLLIAKSLYKFLSTNILKE